MKSFRTFLTEGGAGIPGVSPINQENVADTIRDFYKKLLPVIKLKPNQVATLGSTGKKAPGETSGDIDIAVDAADLMKASNSETLSDLYDYVVSVAKKLSKDIKDSRGLGVISLGFPITNTDGKQAGKTVQIDLFLVSDLEYATWIYHGPSYKESPLKGVYRNILMAQVAKYSAMKTLKDVGGEPTVRERLLFNFSKGLMKSIQSREGKKGLVKDFKTIQSELLSSNPEKITKLLFGDQYSSKDVLTFENVLKIVMDKNFKYKQNRDEILQGTKDTLIQQGYPIPEILNKVI